MKEDIRKYIDNLFLEAPKTREAYELKEELLSNSYDRYFDLLEDGISENDALNIVINSIGDINQLFPNDKESKPFFIDDDQLKKMALYKTMAVGLYMVAVMVTIIFDEYLHNGLMAIISGILIATVATCILIYTTTVYPKYKKSEESIVEEFKEWNFNQKKFKAIKNSIYMILWMLVLIIYFVVSFATNAWYVTWIIYLIGFCVHAICNLIFHLIEN
jgi:hypothetical protein